ncbi:MAG: hypothetical protein AAF434_17215 [Pseudomonadota bacterium]
MDTALRTQFFEEDGKLIVNRVQDVEPILERNQLERNNPDVFQAKGQTFKKLGSIPNGLIEEWMKDEPEIMREPSLLLQKLKDYQYSKLRVAENKYFK